MQFILISLLLAVSCTNFKDLKKAKLIKGKNRSQYEAMGEKYMISTQGAGTTKAAEFALSNGGNIFDAAVAATFAISVERPHSTGIGGGGFMLINHGKSKKFEAYDFREMAPRMAYKKMFLDKNGRQIRKKSVTGPFASGTPGLVAGILEVHKKYGQLPLKIVMQPAIELARGGIKVYPELYQAMVEEKKNLCQYPESKKIFLTKNCEPKKAGSILYQKNLAKTLELIAEKGADGFYKGFVANEIVSNQKKYGGLITHKDLQKYKVKKRTPVVGNYKGHKVVSMPPPSSGGTHIIQILNILEKYDLNQYGPQSATAIHLTSTAMQAAFADRAKYMGDDDFARVPVKQLISKKYAAKLRQMIPMDKALSSKSFPLPFKELKYESDDTTHFSIMDSKGNVVSSTQTINGLFGSAMVAGETGIVMNNEMDDFASHVGGVNIFGAIGGKNNLVEPRKRPLSSMSPTIVYNEKGDPILTVGTPNGTRILTCVMQTILNVLEYEMPLWEAVVATRYHHQWAPDYIRVDDPGLDPKVIKKLESMGHKVKQEMYHCRIQAIAKKSNGTLHGVSDPRGEGLSLGL